MPGAGRSGPRRRFENWRVVEPSHRQRKIIHVDMDGPQARRLLTLAAIYDGATRTEAARLGGVTLQIIRDWVMRFNARGAAGLLDGKSPGQPSRLNDVQRQAIVRMIESGPIPAIHGVVRWRLIDLSQWIYEELRITVAKQTLSRELRAMGFSAEGAHQRVQIGLLDLDFSKTKLSTFARDAGIFDLVEPVLEIHADGSVRRV
jgi:transposase